jgi:aspartyl-tRNA(Asn)/glutamyl-tRNA(Gln) amidotransferase subunit B
MKRQIEVLEDGGRVVQETRLYDPDRDETRSMRSKEEAHDYRYFPEPDLLPLVIDAATIEEVRKSLPELPDQKAARFVSQHGLSDYDAGVLTASRELADYYETVVAKLGGAPKLAANWVMGELSGALNRDNLDVTQSRVDADALAGLLARIQDNTISGKIAKEVFETMWIERTGADRVIDARGLRQITDTSAIEHAIDEVMAKNPQQLAEYRSGKDKLFGFFVGQVMKATGGKANPRVVSDLVRDKLDERYPLLCDYARLWSARANLQANRPAEALSLLEGDGAQAVAVVAYGVLVYSFSFRYFQIFPEERELKSGRS